MEIFLPSRSSSSTQPVSILNLQALSSYFIIIPSKSCYQLTVYDKVSEFYAVHGSLHSQTRRKRKIRTLLQSETGSDFSCLVGAGGFEPPKLKAADLQSVPIRHSGTRPYSFLCVRSPDDLLILAWEMDFVNCFLLFSSKLFCARRRRGTAMRLALCENGGHPSFLLQKYLPDKRQILRLWIAFCAILCYNFGRTEQKTAGAFCRVARREG